MNLGRSHSIQQLTLIHNINYVEKKLLTFHILIETLIGDIGFARCPMRRTTYNWKARGTEFNNMVNKQ